MKRADLVAGILVLLFSGLVIEESLRIPEQAVAAGRTNFAPVPGFLPFWAGLVLALLAIMLIVSAWWRSAPREREAVFPGGWALVCVSLLAASLAVYISVLEVLGYLVDTFLLNVFLLRSIMRAGWRMSVGAAVLASVSLYAIFRLLLGIDLPQNPFGF